MDADVRESDLVWDESQIRASAGGDAERLELAVFLWCERCAQATAQSAPEVVARYERSLVHRLTALAVASEPTSSLCKANRPIRRLIARAMRNIFTQAGAEKRGGLFESVQALLKAFADTKADKTSKVAALYIFGELMLTFGSSVLSLLDEGLAIACKLARNASQAIIVRAHALIVIQKALEGTGNAAHETTVRDIVKQCRPLLLDRSLAVQFHAAKALGALAKHCLVCQSANEVDQILSTALKALESPNQKTKKALAAFLASVLAGTQQDRVPEKTSGGAKGKKDTEEEDDAAESSTVGSSRIEPKPLLSASAMLQILTREYGKAGSSRSFQFGIIMAYRFLLDDLGNEWVERTMTTLVDHILADMPLTKVNPGQWEKYATRNWLIELLEHSLAKRHLSPARQADLAQHLVQKYLKNWPKVLPEQKEMAVETLVIALQALTAIVRRFESSSARVLDEILESSKRLLAHPELVVRLSAASCIGAAIATCPSQLVKQIELHLSSIGTLFDKTSSGNGSKEDGYRIHGLSLCLATLLAIMPEQPLYASMETCNRTLGVAAKICKQDPNTGRELSSIRAQAGWNLIAGIATLGPNFCRIHLSQLFVLWRAALPKPSLHEQPKAGKSDKEWLELLVLRNAVVASLLTFLQVNASKLINLDNGRRLIALLSNTWALLANFNASTSLDDAVDTINTTKTTRDLRELESSLKSKLLQCLSFFTSDPAMEPLHQNLLNTTLASIADPEKFAGSTAAAAIAVSTGTFVDIWHAEDGVASGLTSLDNLELGQDLSDSRDLGQFPREELIWTYRPHARAIEFDYTTVWATGSSEAPVSAATSAIDASIKLFALLYGTQNSSVSYRLLEQLLAALNIPKADKQPARRAAAHFNAMVTLRLLLDTASPTWVMDSSTGKLMRETLQLGIVSIDRRTRKVASQALALLCKLQGRTFSDQQVQILIDLVIHNRDSDARAGCAQSLAELVAKLGGFSMQNHLPTLINILMSLANDSHPTVNHSALEAFSTVINSVSFSFTPYISATATLLARIYQAESHEPYAGSLGLSNISFGIRAYQAFGEALASLIESLGPELATVNVKTRNIVRCCLTSLRTEDSQAARTQALCAIEQLTLLNPHLLDWPVLIRDLEEVVSSSPLSAAQIATRILAQLMQRDINAFTTALAPGLQLRLFVYLADRPELTVLKQFILSWIRQTARTSAVFWISALQRVLANSANLSSSTKSSHNRETTVHDDESAGFAAAAVGDVSAPAAATPVSVQEFAITCIIDLLRQLAEENAREHFDHRYAAATRVPSKGLVVSRIGDVVRMAFSAATSAEIRVRLVGLRLIRIILKHFCKASDPDFPDSLLLEQYQAQIASALTPAFAAESSPLLLASAIRICGVFVGSGLVQDLSRMGRISALLTNALLQSQDPDNLKFGELEVSVIAARTIRLAIASAWAKLHIASLTQEYLRTFVSPHYAILCPLFATALREYAKLKTDPSVLPQGPSHLLGTNLDSLTVAFARHQLLPAYQSSWLDILHAYSHLLADRNHFAVQAILEPDAARSNGKDVSTNGSLHPTPVPMFHGLFGMSFELLCTSLAEQSRDLETSARIGLVTMRALLRPELAGEEILDPEISSELINIALRMIISQGSSVHLELVKLELSLTELYGKRLNTSFKDGKSLSHNFFRLLINVVKEAVTAKSHHRSIRETVLTLTLAFDCMTRIACLFAGETQVQYAAVALRLYSEILKTEGPGSEGVQLTFPVIKGLCDALTASNDAVRSTRVINGFLASILQNIEDYSSRGTSEAKAITRNNARAAASLITFSRLPLSRQNVEDYAYAVSKLFASEGDMARTAFQCLHTLISTPDCTLATEACAAQLLPSVLALLRHCCTKEVDHQSEMTKDLIAMGLTAISSLPFSTTGGLTPKAIAIVIEMLLQLHSLADQGGVLVPSQITDEIMKLAKSSPDAFKRATTQNLTGPLRSDLQDAIRQRLSSRHSDNATSAMSSKIQLKAF